MKRHTRKEIKALEGIYTDPETPANQRAIAETDLKYDHEDYLRSRLKPITQLKILDDLVNDSGGEMTNKKYFEIYDDAQLSDLFEEIQEAQAGLDYIEKLLNDELVKRSKMKIKEFPKELSGQLVKFVDKQTGRELHAYVLPKILPDEILSTRERLSSEYRISKDRIGVYVTRSK